MKTDQQFENDSLTITSLSETHTKNYDSLIMINDDLTRYKRQFAKPRTISQELERIENDIKLIDYRIKTSQGTNDSEYRLKSKILMLNILSSYIL